MAEVATKKSHRRPDHPGYLGYFLLLLRVRWEPLEGLHRGVTSPDLCFTRFSGCCVMRVGTEVGIRVRRLLWSRGDIVGQGRGGEKMFDLGYV